MPPNEPTDDESRAADPSRPSQDLFEPIDRPGEGLVNEDEEDEEEEDEEDDPGDVPGEDEEDEEEEEPKKPRRRPPTPTAAPRKGDEDYQPAPNDPEGIRELVYLSFDECQGDVSTAKAKLADQFNLKLSFPQLAAYSKGWKSVKNLRKKGVYHQPQAAGDKAAAPPEPDPDGDWNRMVDHAISSAGEPKSVKLLRSAKRFKEDGELKLAALYMEKFARALERESAADDDDGASGGKAGGLEKIAMSMIEKRLEEDPLDMVNKVLEMGNKLGLGGQDKDVAMVEAIGGQVQFGINRITDTITEVMGPKPINRKNLDMAEEEDEDPLNQELVVTCPSCNKNTRGTIGDPPMQCVHCKFKIVAIKLPNGKKVRLADLKRRAMRARQEVRDEPEEGPALEEETAFEDEAPIAPTEEVQQIPPGVTLDTRVVPECFAEAPWSGEGYGPDDPQCDGVPDDPNEPVCDLRDRCRSALLIRLKQQAAPVEREAPKEPEPEPPALPDAAYEWWDRAHRAAGMLTNDDPEQIKAMMRGGYRLMVNSGTHKVNPRDEDKFKWALFFAGMDVKEIVAYAQRLADNPQLAAWVGETYTDKEGNAETPQVLIRVYKASKYQAVLREVQQEFLDMATNDGITLAAADKEALAAQLEQYTHTYSDGTESAAAGEGPPAPSPDPAGSGVERPAVAQPTRRRAVVEKPDVINVPVPRKAPREAAPSRNKPQPTPSSKVPRPTGPPKNPAELVECRPCKVAREADGLPISGKYPNGAKVPIGEFRTHLFEKHPQPKEEGPPGEAEAPGGGE